MSAATSKPDVAKPADRARSPGDRSAIALESIARSLARIVTLLETSRPPEVATERELDGANGDPIVKFDPRDWSGQVMAGSRMSRTTPEYLDAVAESLDYAAAHPKAGREKFAEYNRRDAARARGWAARLRAGWVPPKEDPNGPAAAPPPTFDPPPVAAPSTMSSGEFSKALERPPGVGDAWEPDGAPPLGEAPKATTSTLWDDD